MTFGLTPADVEAIATRVVELLDERRPLAALVDADTLAAILGVTRGYVYEHADDLGAVRLGDGPRARMRFDIDKARAALDARQATPEPVAVARARSSRKGRHTTAGSVLRIGGRRAA